ncbi:MAG: AMP-binding protein [Anaerolineae bacterium]|nr:AMP-binding protein [Anaerolineae bacterium]
MPTLPEILFAHYHDNFDKEIMILQQAGHGDQPISYGDLISGAASYAKIYEDCGIRQGEVVILILQHGIELVYSFWGAILHGAIPSIMPFLTEKLLPDRYRSDLASLISVTKPVALVTYRDFEGEVRAALKPGDSVRAVIISDKVLPGSVPDIAALGGFHRSPDDIALLQHSSGTTGLQKGVALSHQAILNQLESYSQALKLNPQDVIVSWLPLYHDMGLIAGFLMPILCAIPLVIMSPFDWVRAPYRLLQAVSKYRGTLSWLPNFAYNFCAQKIQDRHLDGIDLSSWRAISNCSEPMRYESHQMFLERFRSFGLRPEALTTCYAMAENVFAVTQGGIDGAVTVDEIDRDGFQSKREAQPVKTGHPSIKMLSAGKPIPNTEVKILSEKGVVLPDRFVGEIALRSNCMLTGYYNRPDATKKAFLDGWYLTGDYGYMVDGEVFVSGRKKDLIIVGGKNIYPQDIEELAMKVAEVHPGRASAFGVFNEESGTEEVVLVAEVDTKDLLERDRIADEIRRVVTRGSAISLHNVYIVGPNWLVKTSSGKNARVYNREKYLSEINSLQNLYD